MTAELSILNRKNSSELNETKLVGGAAEATPRRPHHRFVIASFLFVLYTAFILTVTMWPSPVTEGSNKVLIGKILDVSHQSGAPAGFDFHALQFVANIAFFVPLGLTHVLVTGVV